MLISIFSQAAMPVVAATGIVPPLVYDNFDGYSDGAFTVNTAGTNNGWKAPASTSAATANIKSRTDGTGKYAQVTAPSASSYYFGQALSAAQKESMVTEFDLNLPEVSPTGSGFPEVIMYNGSSLNSGSIVFRMRAIGSNFKLLNGGTSNLVDLGSYDTDNWYHFKILFDVSVDVNGNTIRNYYISIYNGNDIVYTTTTPFNLYTPTAISVGTIAFQPARVAGAIINVDNVKMYSPIDLSSLAITDSATTPSAISFDNAFNKNTAEYNTTVTNKVSSAIFTPAVDNTEDLNISVNGVATLSGEKASVQLAEGSNPISVVVSKKNYPDIRKVYNFNITRALAAPNVNGTSVVPGDKKLTINWDNTSITGINSIRVYNADNLSNPLLKDIDPNIGNVIIDGLQNGTEYNYIIKSVGVDGSESTGVAVKGTPALVSVTAVKMDKIQVNMIQNTTEKVTASVLPVDANNKAVEYSSMDTSIATVNSNGLITAVKLGETYIIAKSVDGAVMAATRVVVSDSDLTEVKNAVVTQSDSSLTLNWDDSLDTTINTFKIYSYDSTYEYDPLYATAKLVATENRGVKTHKFTGLTNGTTYNYIIRGVRADGTETLGVRVCGIPNSDTLLTDLKLIGIRANGTTKDIELLQKFEEGEVSYSAVVTNDIVNVKGIPTVKNPSNVDIIVNGELVQNGQESGIIGVKSGALNNFGVTVITKDKAISRSYIPVIYVQKPEQTFLKDLKVSGAEDINNNFKQRTLLYSNNYDFTTDKVVITPTAVEGTDAVIKIDGIEVESGVPTVLSLPEGSNNVNIVVTSKVFTKAITTYTLTLNRYTKNDLKDLQVTPGVAVKPFSSGNTKYYVDVQNNVNEISVLPTAFDTNAIVTVNDIPVTSGQASNKIGLKEGNNVINVKVNNTVTYSIYAFRLPLTDYLYMRNEGSSITVRNKYANLVFDTTNSNLITMSKPGDSDVLGNGYGYFLANPTYYDNVALKTVALTAGFTATNTKWDIYSQDENTIDLVFYMTDTVTGPLRYKLHYVINKLQPGMYNYISFDYDDTKVPANTKDWNIGQTRWSVRADENKFNKAHYDSGVYKLISPHHVDGTSVSDATWLLPDGKIHGKYDLVEYEDHKIYGMTGDEYGIWFMKAQDDYTNGMPTSQELAVHETNTTPIINWAPVAAHYGRTIENATSDWEHMWGPMFVYLNKGEDDNTRWTDASAVKDAQVKEWPYNFINNPHYQGNDRGTVTGKINLTNGSVSPEGTTVILSNPNVNWEYQSSQYTYSVKADKDGNFAINDVRAGTYKVYAYQTGVYSNYSAPATVEVKANTTNDIGNYTWDISTFGKKLWEIGVADRTPKEFKNGTIRVFGDFRRYPFDFPNGVDFTIGKSNEKTDWNYAQVPSKTFGTKDLLIAESDDQSWVWKIRFNVDTLPTLKDGKLTIAIAASRAASLKVLLNGTEIKNYTYNKDIVPDDSAYVRSAYQGIYKLLEIPFDTSLLKVGENVISLDPNRTMYVSTVDSNGNILVDRNASNASRQTDVGAAIIYDAIKMEIAEPVKSSDATLSGITLDGTVLNSFAADKTEYNVELPTGTTKVPQVVATSTNGKASATVTAATALPGTTTIVVTAEDGTTTKTYTINFTAKAVEPVKSSDATLSGITIDGTALNGFAIDKTEYNVELPVGTTKVPEVVATVSNGKANAVVTVATELPGTTTIVVTAEDGTTKTYTINFTVKVAEPVKSSDANISEIIVDGTALNGFAADKTEYNVELPTGTTKVPEVAATATNGKANAVVTVATALPGATTVVVTAEDGTTTKTYTINFTVKASQPTQPTQPTQPVDPAPVTTPEVTTPSNDEKVVNIDASTIVKAIEKATDKATVTIDVTNNKLVGKEVFDSIKGTDKTLVFEQNGVQWKFNGKDIKEGTKNIDMTVKVASLADSTAPGRAEIADKVKNTDVMIVSFAENGLLPGKASVKVKMNSAWLNGKDQNNLHVYYYNSTTKKAELVASKLKVDAEGYVEFEITHNSDYFIADKDLVQGGVIPKTGSMLDINVLIALGGLLLISGTGMIGFRRNKKSK
jgi:LPXTG-motif cell wall-anchored protein